MGTLKPHSNGPLSPFLSPFLFAIYVDDVINQLRKCGFGIQIGNMFADCLLYADDIVLLSGSWYGLQKMINISWSFGILWDIKPSYYLRWAFSHQ